MKTSLFCVLCLFFSFTALAANPCQEDMNRFCKKEIDAKENVVGCLQEHRAQLSKACREHDRKMSEVIKTIKPACHPSYQKFCASGDADREPTAAQVTDCLQKHKSDLPADCQKEMGLAK